MIRRLLAWARRRVLPARALPPPPTPLRRPVMLVEVLDDGLLLGPGTFAPEAPAGFEPCSKDVDARAAVAIEHRYGARRFRYYTVPPWWLQQVGNEPVPVPGVRRYAAGGPPPAGWWREDG